MENVAANETKTKLEAAVAKLKGDPDKVKFLEIVFPEGDDSEADPDYDPDEDEESDSSCSEEYEDGEIDEDDDDDDEEEEGGAPMDTTVDLLP